MSRLLTGRSFRFVALVGLTVVAALVAGAVWVGSQLRSPAQAAADAAPPPASNVTSRVERRILSEPVVLRGKVTPGASVKLMPPPDVVGPNSVVTKVHTAKNERIRSGDPVVEIAGRPLFALNLPFTLYRDILGGMEGPDVAAVQKALRALGYSPSRSGKLDLQTQQALGRFYRDRGYQAPVDSEASDKAKVARDGLEQAEAAYRAATKPQGAPTATPEEGQEPNPTQPTVAEAKEQLAEARRQLAKAEVLAGPSLPRAEVMLLPKNGGTVTALRVKVGTTLKAGDEPVAELDGAPVYISAVVDSEQVSLLRVGMQGSVFDDATGVEAQAAISSVGTKQAVDSTTGAAGYQVAFAFTSSSVDASADRSVRVTIPVAASAQPVLAVPVTAVSSRPDGTTFVTLDNEQGGTQEIGVRTGQVAGGWVEIKPEVLDQVAEGDLVVVGVSGSGLSGTE
ncbi:peptidoglycan-binding protein [Micromonospora noduli]|uniref:efflux RND transporter periplasmic adaptor subunit n=1 Tax=Micromonospora noduli TaxID=709876 RepID=UPI003438E547